MGRPWRWVLPGSEKGRPEAARQRGAPTADRTTWLLGPSSGRLWSGHVSTFLCSQIKRIPARVSALAVLFFCSGLFSSSPWSPSSAHPTLAHKDPGSITGSLPPFVWLSWATAFDRYCPGLSLLPGPPHRHVQTPSRGGASQPVLITPMWQAPSPGTLKPHRTLLWFFFSSGPYVLALLLLSSSYS